MNKINKIAFLLGLSVSLISTGYASTIGTVNFNGRILADSCEIATGDEGEVVNVLLGDVEKNVMAAIGSASEPKDFSIKLINCDLGQAVQLRLNGTSVEGYKSLLALTEKLGSAKGVGIGITEKDVQKPLEMNSLTGARSAVAEKGDITFGFTAAYITYAAVTAGNADAVATFDIVYP